MCSATGHARIWNHLGLLSPEATGCLQATNERTLCLGFTHLRSNLLKSLIRCNILPSSYWFLSLLLPFTMMWTTFWCHVIFFCTEKIWGLFGLLFLSCRYLSLFQGKKNATWWLRTSSNPLPHSNTHNYKCSLLGNRVYSNAHIISSSNSGHAQTAVTAIIFWLCINSLSRSLGLVTAFFLVWKMTWLIENKHWSSSVLSFCLLHMRIHILTCLYVCYI